MQTARHNTTRLARLAAIGLCAALAAGCAGSSQPPRPAARVVEKASGEPRVEVKFALPGAPADAKPAPAVKDGGPMFVPAPPKAPPAPQSQPRTSAVVRERVASSLPYPTEADADEDAVAQACEVVARKLSELDPPVHYRPSPAEVRAEFLRKDSRTVRGPNEQEQQIITSLGFTGKRVYVEYDVEVRADQVRELRSQDRVSAGLRVLGGLFALVIAGFLFLRADEWTKGYLTSWLALAAVTLAGAAAAALIFI
jgi:hypothetical protein